MNKTKKQLQEELAAATTKAEHLERIVKEQQILLEDREKFLKELDGKMSEVTDLSKRVRKNNEQMANELTECNRKLLDLEVQHEKLYELYLYTESRFSAMEAQAQFWESRFRASNLTILKRGSLRAQHDRAYAAVREGLRAFIIKYGARAELEHFDINPKKFPEVTFEELSNVAVELGFRMTVSLDDKTDGWWRVGKPSDKDWKYYAEVLEKVQKKMTEDIAEEVDEEVLNDVWSATASAGSAAISAVYAGFGNKGNQEEGD